MFTAANLTLDDLMLLKPKGFFRVQGDTITVHRPGEAVQRIECISEGHANQARMQLTDEGLTGFVEDAL